MIDQLFVPVRPLLRVVANGRRRGKNGDVLKFTLIATPEYDSKQPFTAEDGAFEFANWPKEMAERMRNGRAEGPFAGKVTPAGNARLRLHARAIIAAAIPDIAPGSDWQEVLLEAAASKAFDNPNQWTEINAIWQGSLAGPIAGNWRDLALDIERSLTGAKRSSDLQKEYSGTPVIDAHGAIIAAPHDAEQTVTVKGVVPIRQSDLAIEEESERAVRILAKQQGGPFAVLDEREEPEEAGYEEKFRSVTDGTNEERKRTQATSLQVAALVSGGPAIANDAPKPTTASIIPQPGDVVAEQVPKEAPLVGAGPPTSDRGKRRATHQYGTWLQRRAKYRSDSRTSRPVVDDKPDQVPAAALRERHRGVFFALQGDPTLARLFCMAIDFEVEEARLTEKVAAEKVHLAVWTPSPRRALIATAARRHENGFWPVSAFEAHVVKSKTNGSFEILHSDDLVEQRDGIWRLGTCCKVDAGGGEAAVPRYDIVSLDLRRSIDGKTTGRDRGEEHHTAGFTILDRGRADQIARDLALSAMQAQTLPGKGAVIVLHAEELTVGRRIDIAAVAPGAKLGSVTWRSLMHRYVDFDFKSRDPVAEAVLKQLFPGKGQKGILEEVSFQVAARYMPITGQDVEAVAEEAIFLWDGTPAGVLTDAGVGNVDLPSFFPFDRTFALPDEEGLRVAPLRFGFPYMCRCRSMFLGGGSPDASDESTKATTDSLSVLPVAAGDVAQPRRFLRHESIAAPVLMLPKHLAEARSLHMGYEQADQAIVRSWNDVSSALETISDLDDIRGEYVGGPARTTPESTMRVLLAPEAALDLVVRHGQFDKGNVSRVRRGGLMDVSFAPRPLPDPSQATNTPRPSGFPIVITSKRDTFDPEGAIYRRKLANPQKDLQERGIPVFEPGGTNATPNGGLGYLVDPAINHYSIRARIRGGDRYLEGSIEASAFSEQGYPDVLPLVVSVTKAAGNSKTVRPAHATKISEIAVVAGPTWLDDAGKLGSTKPKRGTRVSHVQVRLYAGEDYDLEVACLPEGSMLARRFSVSETIALLFKAAGADKKKLELLSQICGGEIADACGPAVECQQVIGLCGEAIPAQGIVDKVAANLLAAMKTKWPVEEVAAVTTLRVCHAVNKPALLANWRNKASLKAVRQDYELACDVILNPKLSDELKATGLFLQGQIEVDLALVDTLQIVAETVATDGALLDSRDRGRSSISKRTGRWPVMMTKDGERAYVSATDVVGFRVAEDGSVTLPHQTVTLLNVGNLPAHGALGQVISLVNTGNTCEVPEDLEFGATPTGKNPGEPVFGPTTDRLTQIELAPLFAAAGMSVPIIFQMAMEEGAKDVARRTRVLKIQRPHVFKDTLARKLTLKLVSTSRHAAAFETTPRYLQGREQLLYRRQPLKRTDQAVMNTDYAEIWMRSTVRPAVPDLRRPEPSFTISRKSEPAGDGKKHILVRTAKTRLYFGRGWFSSGEGERVGIVLWPPDYATLKSSDVDADKIRFNDRNLRVRDFEDSDLGEGGSFITRWGGDPIRKDPTDQEANFIPPDAFEDLKRLGQAPHRPEIVPRALMPIPRAASGTATEYLPVSLLTYEPCFDLDREEWYVDVDLKPIRASEPFVRFGIVRYQAQSISPSIMVSEPVSVTMQLLAERQIEITTKGKDTQDRFVSIRVSGLGSHDIKDIFPDLLPDADEAWSANFDTLRRPKMKLSLFHEVEDGENGVVRTPIETTPEKSTTVGPAMDENFHCEVEPTIENANLVWEVDFNFAAAALDDLGRGRIVAYVEEVDRRMPAAYRKEPAPLKSMFALNSFVESGPRFSARVPFLEKT
ncbi:hypothetical protein [Rhizobium sp. CF142]|uniref:hypothetical protein n=1 Tax=Rhizobium sp. CF142 TaxID=1144314 RepID=UPI00026EEF6C|nr:hypothetical protein [Rhizobium sp. CF142]EJJ27756.1 hypothetical protein PMI11_03939 [Rhizobium sp. CF142]